MIPLEEGRVAHEHDLLQGFIVGLENFRLDRRESALIENVLHVLLQAGFVVVNLHNIPQFVFPFQQKEHLRH